MHNASNPVLMPEYSALLAVDVIGSGGNRSEHLRVIPGLVCDLAEAALRAVGLSSAAALDDQFTGDGFRRAYPSRFLPALVDAISVLDELLAANNKSSKPEIRLRVAVHLGPLPTERGLHRPNIDLSRMLDAAELKQIVRHCREHITADAFTTALILSDNAYHAVFQEDYPRTITRNEFAPVPITNKGFSEHCWVRVTGVHPTQLTGIPLTELDSAPTEEFVPAPENASDKRSINNSGTVPGYQVTEDNAFHTTSSVNNYAGQGNTVIQAGTFSGNINQGEQAKYTVNADHAKGIQIGDGNTQHVNFRRSSHSD